MTEEERLENIDRIREHYETKPQPEKPNYSNKVLFDPLDNENLPEPDTGGLTPVNGKYTIKGVEYDEEDIEFQNGVPFVKREAREKYAGPSGIEQIEQANIRVKERLSAPGQGLFDFGMDLVGMVPGLGGLDDAYDEATKYQDPGVQKFREISSIVLPTMIGSGAAIGAIGKSSMPKLLKRLTQVGATAAVDAAVTYTSDTTDEGDNLLRGLDDLTGGSLNIPDQWMTLDSDSTEVRKKKNTYEAVGFSLLGDVLGYGINLGKALKGQVVPNFMDWFKAGDDIAEAYKKQQLRMGPDIRPGEAPFEAHVRNQSSLRDWQIDENAVRQLEAEAQSFDLSVPRGSAVKPEFSPAITPKLASEASNAVLSVPPAAVARNALDVAAIKSGVSTGSPSPVITDPTYQAVVRGDVDARDVVMDVPNDYASSGNWEGYKKGFRFTQENMDTEAWKIYTEVMEAPSVDELRRVLTDNSDMRTIFAKQKRQIISDEGARAAAFAYRDLVDKYIGRDVVLSSARVMDTTANEITDLADGGIKFANLADQARIKNMLLERMAVLYQEIRLNQHISGWSLNNTNFFGRTLPQETLDQKARELLESFDAKKASIVAESDEFIEELKVMSSLGDSEDLMRAFGDAFVMSKGDINTMDKLMKWGRQQLSMKGMIKSGKGGMNMFAQGLWSVRYNNVLSGLSALRAGVGNTTSLIAKATTAIMGHGLEAAMGDTKNFRRAMYTYGAFWETNRRALGSAWEAWKRTNDDPSAFMDLMRKDRIVARDNEEWELMQTLYNEKWRPEGDTYMSFKWNWTVANKRASEARFMRWGTNAMIASDQYVNATLATHKARTLAYEEVFQKTGGKVTKKLLRAAEEKHYNNMFDKNGLIKDKAVKESAGELALNLDTEMSTRINSFLNDYPVFKSFFMFPRTGINAVRLGLSYIPVANLASNKKIAKILLAGDDPKKISEALALHQVKPNDPAAMTIFENLRAEYKGRMALGSMILASGLGYAWGGNLRGNGPVNAAERKLLRDNFNWQPKTIKIGNKWVSYAGIEPFDTLLTVVGDMAYYATDLGSNTFDDFEKKMMWTLTASFTNKTFASGLDPLVQAFNGDTRHLSRILANEGRSYIPMSGALGVFANAITSSQKDIHNDMLGYIQNRLPIAKAYLPDRIDVWTGKPINDIDNHFLRALNAFNPVPISDGPEPWRQWLLNTGWDGMRLLRRDSTGKYEYSPAERQELYTIMGNMNLWKKIEKLSKSPKINAQIDALRRARAANVNFTYSDFRSKDLQVYKELNHIISEAQKEAETTLLLRNPTIEMKIEGAQMIKSLLAQGRVEQARKVGKAYQVNLDQIVQDD